MIKTALVAVLFFAPSATLAADLFFCSAHQSTRFGKQSDGSWAFESGENATGIFFRRDPSTESWQAKLTGAEKDWSKLACTIQNGLVTCTMTERWLYKFNPSKLRAIELNLYGWVDDNSQIVTGITFGTCSRLD